MKRYVSLALVFCILALTCLALGSCGAGSGSTNKLYLAKTRMIAHRGASGLEVENTDAAFIAAGKRSYYGIEGDVRKTLDGKYVMCHDADLSRIAGVDMVVEESTYDDLANVVLYDKNSKKDNNSLRISTLESFVSICKEYNKVCVLELKSKFEPRDISEIIDIIDAVGWLHNVVFISFSYDNLLYARELLPDQTLQYLTSEVSDEFIATLQKDRIDVSIRFTALSWELIKKLHNADLRVGCWTVDYKPLAALLIFWGVDYLTTNVLE